MLFAIPNTHEVRITKDLSYILKTSFSPLADLPYAHETLGDYENVFFFDPNSSRDLAEKMELDIKGENIKFDGKIKKNIE